MDSLVIVLENSSGFLSFPPGLEHFLLMLLLASDPESEDSTVVLLLNFDGILQQKWVPSGVLKICFGGFF